MQSKHTRFVFFSVLALAVLLAACGGGDAGQAAAKAAEGYIQALAAKDVDKLTSLSCASWEEQARLELDSFQAVTPALEGLACKKSGEDGATQLVSCSGKIILTYNTEKMELGLDNRTYQVVQEGSEWVVCGYR